MNCARISRHLLHWIYPQRCAHCREDLPALHEEPLCARCRLKLSFCERPLCSRCGEPVSPDFSLCLRCRKPKPSVCRMIRAPFLYRDAAVSLVHAFKYRGRASAARTAGAWMAGALERFPELHGFEALVPVPLHGRRLRVRGYNQARLIAEGLSAALAIPLLEALIRVRPTKPQWSLDAKSREKNLLGAFEGLRSRAADRRLLLVDDVCTSAASLDYCARALKDAGALDVCGYAFAREVRGSEK